MRATPHPTSRRLAAPLLAGALALAALTACSGGASDSGAGGSSGVTAEDSGGAARQDLVAPDAAGKPAAPVEGTDTTTVLPAVAERKLARRADVALQVKDVARAASTLRTIATRAGGLVVSEQVSTDPVLPSPSDGGTGRSEAPTSGGTVTISVPTEKLDATLDEVAEVGTVLSRQSSTEDVTAQYVDTAARVETMKASVERVRALMSTADKLADVVNLEAELSRRQADLEATESRLAALDDQVSLSPVTVSLSTAAGALTQEEDPTGFLAGLASGWDAFTTSVRLLLTLVGALVPFAVAAAVVLVPLALWWRRRRVTVTTPVPPVPPVAPTT